VTEIQNSKPAYELEQRNAQFAKAVRLFVKKFPSVIEIIEDGKQFISFAPMFWSRAAQALAPRVGYWNLRFTCPVKLFGMNLSKASKM